MSTGKTIALIEALGGGNAGGGSDAEGNVAFATDDEVVAEMLEAGAMPVIQTETGAILQSAENTILLI